MSSNREAFEAIAAWVKTAEWSSRLSNDDKLVLYALFKQATVGDAPETNPASVLDLVANAKYNAWSQLRGLAGGCARASYIEEVDSFRLKYSR